MFSFVTQTQDKSQENSVADLGIITSIHADILKKMEGGRSYGCSVKQFLKLPFLQGAHRKQLLPLGNYLGRKTFLVDLVVSQMLLVLLNPRNCRYCVNFVCVDPS